MVQVVEQAETGAANEARRMVLKQKDHAGASVATTAERESRCARGAELGKPDTPRLGLHRLLGGEKSIGLDLVLEGVLFHAGGVASSLGWPLRILANRLIERLIWHQ